MIWHSPIARFSFEAPPEVSLDSEHEVSALEATFTMYTRIGRRVQCDMWQTTTGVLFDGSDHISNRKCRLSLSFI